MKMGARFLIGLSVGLAVGYGAGIYTGIHAGKPVTLARVAPSDSPDARKKENAPPAPPVYKVGSTYYAFDESFVKYFGTNAIPDMLTTLEKSER
jgi:hypothetical protein